MTLSRRAAGAPLAALGLVLAVSSAGSASAATSIDLGTAATFAVLAGTTVTNTGPSTIGGDVGVSPGTAMTGFGTATVTGTQHSADGVADRAQSDLAAAYLTAAGEPVTARVGSDLGGRTLAAGVYAGPTLGLTGTLTLDAENDPNAIFVFQAGSTLITASTSVVALVRGASACNVFWQVGSSATLGTNSVFAGSVLALTSISATTGAKVTGRLLARNGATTLDSNTVLAPTCTTPTPSPTGSAAPAPSPTGSAAPAPSPTGSAAPAPSPTGTSTSTPSPTGTASPSATASSSPSAPSAAGPDAGASSTPAPVEGSTRPKAGTGGPTAGNGPAPGHPEGASPTLLARTGAPLADLAVIGVLAVAGGALLLLLPGRPSRRRQA